MFDRRDQQREPQRDFTHVLHRRQGSWRQLRARQRWTLLRVTEADHQEPAKCLVRHDHLARGDGACSCFHDLLEAVLHQKHQRNGSLENLSRELLSIRLRDKSITKPTEHLRGIVDGKLGLFQGACLPQAGQELVANRMRHGRRDLARHDLLHQLQGQLIYATYRTTQVSNGAATAIHGIGREPSQPPLDPLQPPGVALPVTPLHPFWRDLPRAGPPQSRRSVRPITAAPCTRGHLRPARAAA